MALKHKEFGERLAQIRFDAGNPPQERVAGDLGVSYRTYQSWELGEAEPSHKNKVKLAEYFAVEMPFLLSGRSEPRVEVVQLDRIEAMLTEVLARMDEHGLTLPSLEDELDAAADDRQRDGKRKRPAKAAPRKPRSRRAA
jgi:transcriptional regulator with XRE-family HTH domain